MRKYNFLPLRISIYFNNLNMSLIQKNIYISPVNKFLK